VHRVRREVVDALERASGDVARDRAAAGAVSK